MNKTQRIFLLGLLLGIIIFVPISHVLGQGGIPGQGTITVTITPQTFVTESSYIISKQGTTYYARNGLTGAIDYSGTDVSAVAYQAEHNLPSQKGKITFLSGVYDFSSSLVIDNSNVTICGEGASTVFRAVADINLIILRGGASYWERKEHASIMNLALICIVSSTKAAIKYEGIFWYTGISDIKIEKFAIGIFLPSQLIGTESYISHPLWRNLVINQCGAGILATSVSDIEIYGAVMHDLTGVALREYITEVYEVEPTHTIPALNVVTCNFINTLGNTFIHDFYVYNGKGTGGHLLTLQACVSIYLIGGALAG